ncbi:Outer membrane protein assembly factor BamB precursor [Rubripirellula lacrimiformis]|uniref:Outer membrane protein assembly factor BamB n=1 Tax=Rubripirellula lacrimiformis TaxID=1930273 RepID=A0A517NFP0_9BACT|nr:PQQ-binding-like beta-propeller repeat protein [Rubripirellula lacrimiformis]QDT05944.1 Outer membrane protein assembly factor BamB precursor [Rubripirellula lacrimiformis]
MKRLPNATVGHRSRHTHFSVLYAAVFTIVAIASAGSPLAAVAQDWNQWRGPNRDGIVSETQLPTKLKGNLKLLWQKSLSPSYSGPVVRDGRVFTTETIDKSTERVTAYDVESGDLIWTVQWAGAVKIPMFAASNGDWIRSTPVCSKNNLLVLGMRDVLVSLDPSTGDEQWRVDFPATIGTPLPMFGAVSSPLIDGDSVYIQTGGPLCKLSLADGTIQWKSLFDDGVENQGAFSSPTIATIASVRQLVVQTRDDLCGVDMESGDPLWKEPIESFRGMNILTPVVIGDRVFTSAHSGRAQMFEIDRDDTGQWTIDELWSQKTQAYMSSPIVIGKTIYLHAKNQRLVALSIDDGAIRWTSEPFGKYWSMIGSKDRFLALDESGELLLVAADDQEFKRIDQYKVAEDSWAHLAIDGNRLVIRDLSALKVFEFQQ